MSSRATFIGDDKEFVGSAMRAMVLAFLGSPVRSVTVRPAYGEGELPDGTQFFRPIARQTRVEGVDWQFDWSDRATQDATLTAAQTLALAVLTGDTSALPPLLDELVAVGVIDPHALALRDARREGAEDFQRKCVAKCREYESACAADIGTDLEGDCDDARRETAAMLAELVRGMTP